MRKVCEVYLVSNSASDERGVELTFPVSQYEMMDAFEQIRADQSIFFGDSETYYILSGKGRYNDNGTIVEIGPGDVAYCAPGEGHGLACHGEEPVEMIALILYK